MASRAPHRNCVSRAPPQAHRPVERSVWERPWPVAVVSDLRAAGHHRERIVDFLLVQPIQKHQLDLLTHAVSSMIFSSNACRHDRHPDNKTGRVTLARDGAQGVAHHGCFDMAGSCYRPHPIRFVDVGGGIDPIFPNGRTRRARKNKRQQSRSTGAASKSGSEFANGSKDTRNVICNANRNCSTPRRTRRGSMRYHGSPCGERPALPQIQGGLPRL